METRITPPKITRLAENEIFVFGSNLAGVHGAGAAKDALQFGAKIGVGSGFSGQTYAVPTKDFDVRTPLSIGEIAGYIKELKFYIAHYSDKFFLITPIGCGLAGYTPEQIAPLFWDKEFFEKCENFSLPLSFWKVLENDYGHLVDAILYFEESMKLGKLHLPAFEEEFKEVIGKPLWDSVRVDDGYGEMIFTDNFIHWLVAELARARGIVK